jgi:hypothetical protein
MAIGTLTNAMILINGVDLSDHCSAVHLTDSRANIDITAMGALNIAYTKGLGDATAAFDFFQDTAPGKVHYTLQPLIASTTGVTVEVRPNNAIRSALNPAYLMTALLFDYPFLDGKVGDANLASYTFRNSSQAGVTYPIA